MRSGDKGRTQGPPAFPAIPHGASPTKEYQDTLEADRAPFPLPEGTQETPSPPHAAQTGEIAFGEGVARRELPRLSQATRGSGPGGVGPPAPPRPSQPGLPEQVRRPRAESEHKPRGAGLNAPAPAPLARHDLIRCLAL